jgi:hypothetical protein
MRTVCDAVLDNKVPLMNEEVLIEFINRMITTQTNFESLTVDGYHFYQTFFILMN